MRLTRVAGLLALVGLCGCAPLRYYAHVGHGQLSLLARREPIARAIVDERIEAGVRERLRRVQAARRFASERLDLPDNRSYTSYVQLDRPFVTWSVFAAKEFSVEPVTHCFPIAGCVAYLGYFDRTLAEREAKRLAEQGDDTAVRGVAAFSTLGWFADPIVSSMLRGGDDELDGVVFHELAHQKVYLRDDSAFNESYASFVAMQGLRDWHAANHLPAPVSTSGQDRAFTHLVLDLRERLRALYATGQADAVLRRRKHEEIDAFRERYAHLRDQEWNGDDAYDAFVAAPINNASLVPFGLYDRWTDAFAALFARDGADWALFHEDVRALARLPAPQRARRLAELSGAKPD
ncbi:aminopeptidase [Dokdonella sp.]|uniref:aminopeptidase n=1 Tax=Dokdonella sp. TaxID=2291710 RepID=UPI0037840645